MMYKTNRWTRRASAVGALAAAGALAFSGVAFADTVTNDVSVTGNNNIVAGGSASVNYTINVQGGGLDGQGGCNASDGSPATVVLSVPTGVSASATSLSFNKCAVSKSVSFSAADAGDYTIGVSNVNDAGTDGGTYDWSAAAFVLHVSAPAPTNTKPTVAVTGVDKASYEIGSQPTPMCSVTDDHDSPSPFAAVLSGTLSHGLGSQTATCDYTDQGGLAADTKTATYTIVDTGNPTISHTISPSGGPDGANGWYKSPVKVHFDCADSGSGIQSCTADQTLNDGADQSVTGTATDWANNRTTDVVSGINVDASAPNAPDATIDPQPNGAGWNDSDVTVHFASAGDIGPSGVDHCSDDVTVNTEGASQTAKGSCTDKAGNVSDTRTVTVKLDKTGPSISDSVSGNSGSNGWYTSDVTVTFKADDSLSGVDGASSSMVTSNGEGDSVQVQSPAFSDIAGNTTVAGTDTKTFKIDKTKPSLPTFSGGPNGDVYYGYVPANPTCTATDGGSGLDSCVVTGYSTDFGAHVLTATATDKAGNQNTATQTYTVDHWNTKGFYQPVDMSGVINTVKGGSTVPMKFNVYAGSELTSPSAAVKSFTTKAISCSTSAPTDDIETVTTGGTSLRYDTTAGQFVQNWQTPKKPGTCAMATITTVDGTTINANFQFK